MITLTWEQLETFADDGKIHRDFGCGSIRSVSFTMNGIAWRGEFSADCADVYGIEPDRYDSSFSLAIMRTIQNHLDQYLPDEKNGEDDEE